MSNNDNQTISSSTSSLNSSLLQLITTLAGNMQKDTKAQSIKDMSLKTMENLKKIANESKPVKLTMCDAYGNSLTSIGKDDKAQTFTSYGFDNNTLNWMLWTALYNDSWVFKRVIDKPAQDMVRAGITLNCNDKNVDKVYEDVVRSRKPLIELIQWGRLYGGSIAVMMFDNLDEKDYANSMSLNLLKKSKKMTFYVTDRWYGCNQSEQTVTDMCNQDFGKPESYVVTFANGKNITVHHDFILRCEGRNAPKFIKTGMLQGWGYAEGSHILNELSRDDQIKASITSLINKSLIEVIKMAGMRGLFMGSDPENEKQIRARLEMVNWARNFNSLTFLDKDDEYQEHGFSGLGGLDALLNSNMKLVSAACEMQGILFGDLSDGFSKDSDAYERYDETINGLNEDILREPLEKLIRTLYKKYDINEEVKLTFNSLIKEKIDEKKVKALKNFQELVSAMYGDGILSAKNYALSMKSYTEKSVIDFHFDDKEINELDDKVKEEMENIDIDKELSSLNLKR